MHCVPVDLVAGDVGALPADADYVLHFAVVKSNRWELDMDANVGGLAALMEHHRAARAFLHCSTVGVYQPGGHRAVTEDAPLGDSHAVWPFLRTYSIAKIAAEAVARWGARRFDLPTTIARLSVPYGDNGGWPAVHLELLRQGAEIPVHVDGPSVLNPLHQDDIAAMVPGLLSAAAVPATTVNWGGDQAVSIEEWCTYLAGLCGLEARLAPTADTLQTVEVDLTRCTSWWATRASTGARGSGPWWKPATPSCWWARTAEPAGPGPRPAPGEPAPPGLGEPTPGPAQPAPGPGPVGAVPAAGANGRSGGRAN